MRLDIRGLNLDLTESLLGHVRERLHGGLRAFGPRVASVTVRVNDVNGHKGGPDKRCHLEVALEGGGTAVVEHTDPDAYAAVDKAVARLRRVLRRQVDRPRSARLSRRVSASGLPT